MPAIRLRSTLGATATKYYDHTRGLVSTVLTRSLPLPTAGRKSSWIKEGTTHRLLVAKELARVEELARDARDDGVLVLDLGALVQPVARQLEHHVLPVAGVFEVDLALGA